MIRTDGSTLEKNYKTAEMIVSYFKNKNYHFPLGFGLYCKNLVWFGLGRYSVLIKNREKARAMSGRFVVHKTVTFFFV